ncbi:hypothetical protein CBL_11052 [Carabus blaptoides fortunei]
MSPVVECALNDKDTSMYRLCIFVTHGNHLSSQTAPLAKDSTECYLVRPNANTPGYSESSQVRPWWSTSSVEKDIMSIRTMYAVTCLHFLRELNLRYQAAAAARLTPQSSIQNRKATIEGSKAMQVKNGILLEKNVLPKQPKCLEGKPESLPDLQNILYRAVRKGRIQTRLTNRHSQHSQHSQPNQSQQSTAANWNVNRVSTELP